MARKHLTLEQLITILAKVEGIFNTCPLTYVYGEFDSGFTLTSAHFVMLYFLPLMIASADVDESDYNYYPMDSATSLLEVWKKDQQQLNSF